VKQGASRIQYNSVVGNVWSTVEVANGTYLNMWVIATFSMLEPIMVVLGQTNHSTLAAAQAEQPIAVNLTGLPLQNGRLICKLIYQSSNSYANIPHARIREVQDYRSSALIGNNIQGPAGPLSTNENVENTAVAFTSTTTNSYVDVASGSLAIPSAGRWLVTMSLFGRVDCAAGDQINYTIDITNSSNVSLLPANGVGQIVYYNNSAVLVQTGGTIAVSKIMDFTTAQTIKLRHRRNGTGTGNVFGGIFNAIRLGPTP
jgi:hypothetical protein